MNINSRISEISNDEVRNFITERMKVDNGGGYYNRILREDYYIYDVIIKHSFPDDYDGIIRYQDNIKTEKRIHVSDEESNFIKNNMKDRANEFAIKSTLLWIAGDILYIGLIALTQKDLKLIAKRNGKVKDLSKQELKVF